MCRRLLRPEPRETGTVSTRASHSAAPSTPDTASSSALRVSRPYPSPRSSAA